jgi:hypothetical protein
MKLTNPDIAGRGYIGVDNPESFDLPEPYSVNLHFQAKPAYMMSVFHQLHCLVRIIGKIIQ